MNKIKKLSNVEWMEKHLHLKTGGWEDLVQSGHANLDELEDGGLKPMLNSYIGSCTEIDKKLESLGYEAG